MTKERRQLIESLFESAVRLSPDARAAFLDGACASDTSLRPEVELLLRLDNEAQQFLESPAIEMRFGQEDRHSTTVTHAAASGRLDQDLTGTLIGVYKVTARIGEGGMGVVYRARDMQLDRMVAIKVLPPDCVADPDRRRRFIHEAKAASALNHPNIITIHSIVQDAGAECIVMEYVAGHTLAAAIPKSGLPVKEVLRIAIEIADALTAAHEAGIVHRDLNPANIMLTGAGRVKVLDFGLAKLVRPDEGEPVTTLTPTYEFHGGVASGGSTERGVILGTAPYMSPEQAEGRKLDARSDIFSFGAVLYEMITGHRPFEGPSSRAIVLKILREDPKVPRDIGAPVPAELETLVLRCLEKDAGRRYQTMADVRLALENIREQSSSEPQPAARLPRRGVWGGTAAAAMAVLAAGLFGGRQRPAAQFTEPLRAVPLTTSPGVKHYPSFAPDGNHVVFTWSGPKQDSPDIYVQQIGAGTPLRLTSDPHDEVSPVWSPDGQWIAFLRVLSPGKSELRLIPPLGGPERLLAEMQYVYSPPSVAWLPDNQRLVVAGFRGEKRQDALLVVSLATKEPQQLTYPQAPYNDLHPAVSPDGRYIVFRRHRGVGTGELYWLGLDNSLTASGEPQRVASAPFHGDYPTWMPNGKEILFSARGGLWRTAVPGGDIPARLPFVGEDGLMPAVSRPSPGESSRLAYVRSFEDSNIWRIDTRTSGMPGGAAPVIAISSTRRDFNPSFSPDAGRVAFDSDRSGSTEVWIADPDGSNAVQLTSNEGASTGFAKWSPDGRLIAFHSNMSEEWRSYLIPATGGKPSFFAGNGWPSFSRDGKWIYFGWDRTGRHEVWKMGTLGGDAIQITRNGAKAGFESVDGRYLYYRQNPDGPGPLWRIPVAGGEAVKVLDGMFDFCLLERGIYYIDLQTQEANLRFLSFATGNSTLVARNLGKVRRGLTASSSGRTILYARVDSSVDDLIMVENFR